MSGEIHRVLPLGNLKSLDPMIAEQNAYYTRTTWALYKDGVYTGDWSYNRDWIERQCQFNDGRAYAEVAPGDIPLDNLSDQRRRMFE